MCQEVCVLFVAYRRVVYRRMCLLVHQEMYLDCRTEESFVSNRLQIVGKTLVKDLLDERDHLSFKTAFSETVPFIFPCK